jgi:hypothetical protein
MEGAKVSEIIVVWDFHVLGGIELLLHLSDLLLVDLNLSWSEHWGLNEGKSWLTKKLSLQKGVFTYLVSFLRSQTNGFSN